MSDDDKTKMLDDGKLPENENQDQGPDIESGEPAAETHLSMTEVENLITQHNASEEAEESPADVDPDATVIMTPEPDQAAYQDSSPTQGTVLSATEVEQLETRHQLANQDPDATVIMKSDDAPAIDDDATILMDGQTEATVLAGGTEAVMQQMQTAYSPKVNIGSVIKDRFTLEKLLGRGGMGEVYLATDKRKLEAQDKNPYIAFKVLGENFKRHPQAFVALQREARKTQELAHPNIVTVYDFDRQDDIVYITMEAMSGKPMDEEIRADVRPLEEAVDITFQCASGLAYAHKKNLVHSDLKPGNLFLTEEGVAKLLDFGIARAFKSGKELDEKDTSGKDDTVFDAGELGALTPAYASYEMLTGQEPHPSDDVYALGLIAYELLTGKHPYDKKMATKAMEAGMVLEKVPGLKKQQWKALEGALAFRREDRLQDAQEFLDVFTAKSKTPLYIAAVLVLVGFIAVGFSTYYLKDTELAPDIPFADLPPETQQQVLNNIEESKIALKFNDFNGAFQYLDTAFNLHPYNPDVAIQTDAAIETLIQGLSEAKGLSNAEKAKQIDVLMEYPSLSNNEALINYKSSLQ